MVDLDNPKTYDYLPTTCELLDALMFKEIGYALVYMNYFQDRKKYFPKTVSTNCGYQQRHRVEQLIKEFANNRQQNINNLKWYQEQVFLFQDETENMC